MSPRSLSRADLAIGVAVLLLIWASVTPTLRARSFRAMVERSTAEVEKLRDAATGAAATTGDWPGSAPAGEAPGGLEATYPGDRPLAFDGFTLQWTRLAVVGHEEAPPVTLAAPTSEPGAPRTSVAPPRPVDAPPDSVGPEMVPVVRRIGAVVVHTRSESLLAELLARHGPNRSYVRDSTWTLLVPAVDGPSP